ncbi:RsmB/NOP family class I SAM-dependent RNA methyltransferase [Sphingomonas sp. 1P06PA]|uniref:RsmB/NOP family class I SAM-dependent RNA methyltransferase n=1 Tax=Sphingomonas sp. 1P06PA TaxID=554121 RepID=UPI0039A6185E
MTPGARAQAAIELLDQIILAARDGGAAADTLIARYFKTRRYAGSKDRRAVRDLVYAAIRRSGERPVSGRAALLGVAAGDPAVAALFDGGTHAPDAIAASEKPAGAGVAPGWLAPQIEAVVGPGGMAALLDRAPLDVRVNRLRADRAGIAIAGAMPTPHAPDGLRLPEGTDVETLEAWHDGLIEVQDEGSQLVSLAAGAQPGMTVIDLCAGGGGKTLALAAMMAGQGRLIATDTDRGRLSRLAPRAERAGVSVETQLLDPGREGDALVALIGAADVVLVDAPCSGTGTWRRNPEARWRLTPKRLEQLVALQARLLDLGAELVMPGGVLVYIVCSLLDAEGADQAAGFLDRHPGWRGGAIHPDFGTARGSGRVLTPARDGTDGFFVARLERPC